MVVGLLLGLAAPATARYHQNQPAAGHLLQPHEYVEHQPNELGRIPVFMYHNIVPNDYDTSGYAVDPYMFRTYDEFWNDMLWLYEHDFHLIGMKDLVSGNIDIPAGKHPVVFTFDDGSWRHFSIIEKDDGHLYINQNSAVGLMEKFYLEYPDFGRGAYFAMVPAHKFSWPEHEEDEHFELKLHWLMENGYEVGNHTLSHPNLNEIDAEEFEWTVAEPILWGDEVFGRDHDTNAMRILTLPFGIYPAVETSPQNNKLLHEGFTYEGHDIQIEAVLLLKGGSSVSPWDVHYDPFHITRLPVQDDVIDLLKEMYETGGNVYYTSDGIVDAVTVPNPMPEILDGDLDRDAIASSGKQLVEYHPDSGEVQVHVSSAQIVWVRMPAA